MTRPACLQPLTTADLVDYWLGDLESAGQAAVEEHLFSCDACSRALESIVQLGADIARSMSEGHAAATVTRALLTRVADGGARVREYHLAPGETVPCTASPEDTFVAVRLGGALEGITGVSLEIDFHDLAAGSHGVRHVDDVPVDVGAREVVLLFPAETVRAFPRSRWTMRAQAIKGGSSVQLGPYTLDHTPWEQLPRA